MFTSKIIFFFKIDENQNEKALNRWFLKVINKLFHCIKIKKVQISYQNNNINLFTI